MKRERVRIWVAAALIPLALWVCYLANRGLPRRLAHEWFGPGEQTPGTSAPPRVEWDVATMLSMLAIACGATLFLIVQCARWWTARHRDASR